MSMYLSIGTTIADMEDAYGTASADVRLERIARREPVATRLAEFLRRTARALLATAAHPGPPARQRRRAALPDGHLT